VLWPLVLFFALVAVAIPGLLVVSMFIGERHRQRATVEPYESGIAPTGTLPVRFAASYYLVAVLFVLFDVESIFLFAWAIAAREAGWKGYAVMTVFVLPLFLLIAYLWSNGALDWRTSRQREDARLKQRRRDHVRDP
jgi:NADH-quinone oxidoreductase subunit A